jgi:predicted dithiol-disulfide oxidoreductase (DUF899 family)
MFGPSYQAGCPVTSSMADGFDGLLPHLHARVPGYLSESPAVSVFTLQDGTVYQTYSAAARDRAPEGRDEDDGLQLWIRRHDEYDNQ